MRTFMGTVIALFFSSTVVALPSVVPDRIPCVTDLEIHFFPEHLVNQGLSLYNVRQELWLLINQRLQSKSLEVPDRMKTRTAYMVPNPIEYPMQRAATAKILKEVLAEVLRETLQENYINGSISELIFDYIFTEQMPKFIRCFGPEAKELQPNF